MNSTEHSLELNARENIISSNVKRKERLEFSPLRMRVVSGGLAKWANEFAQLRAFDDERVGVLETMTHAFSLTLAVGQAETASTTR